MVKIQDEYEKKKFYFCLDADIPLYVLHNKLKQKTKTPFSLLIFAKNTLVNEQSMKIIEIYNKHCGDKEFKKTLEL